MTTKPIKFFRLFNELAIAAGLVAVISACGGDSGGGSGGGGGGASQSEVNECHDACNQLKFFDCNDAVDHATCFQHCDAASSDQIELFSACVKADICDPACSTNLEPEDPTTPVNPDSCSDLCGDYLGQGCMPDIPASACSQVCASDPGLVAYCLGNRDGCSLPAGCEPEPNSPSSDCKNACEQQGLFQCITGPDVATCSSLCDTAPPSAVEDFSSCAAGGICQDDSCYRLLNPNGGSADVAGCKQACDDMQFFDCIDAPTLSLCRDHCEEASADAVDSFKACASGACNDDSCWVVFSGAS